MFNPRPQVTSIPIGGIGNCLLVDDALIDPDRWVDYACYERQAFAQATGNGYPGLELYLPPFLASQLEEFFRVHIRGKLGGKRILDMHSRLSIVTRQPHELSPLQWLCHRDRLGANSSQCVSASVLYLFRDADLGGTSFYVPRKDPLATEQIIKSAASMQASDFSASFGIQPGYQVDSNDYFLKVCEVPARWNRIIFYDGSLFHSSTIRNPTLLSADPRQGRLTMNGFFTCSKKAI